jgi:hypothetical protein
MQTTFDRTKFLYSETSSVGGMSKLRSALSFAVAGGIFGASWKSFETSGLSTNLELSETLEVGAELTLVEAFRSGEEEGFPVFESSPRSMSTALP